MNDTPLNRFLERIMRIGNGFIGMGSASIGIVGATTANDHVYNNLRQTALDFASEYSKKQPDPERLADLAENLEGSLQSARALFSLSDQTFEELIGELESLMKAKHL